MLMQTIWTCFAILTSSERYQFSKKQIEQNTDWPANRTTALTFFDFATWLTIVLLVTRSCLLVATIKWPKATRLVFYVEAALQMAECFLPVNMPASYEFRTFCISNTINFLMCYFAFLPAFAVSIISLIPLFIARALFFEEAAGLMVLQFIFTVVIQAATILIIHLVVTKVGLQMIELKLKSKSDQ